MTQQTTKKLKLLSKILTLVFAVFLAIVIGLSVIGGLYADAINDALQIRLWRIENIGETNEDTEYYKSKYSSVSELMVDKEELIRRICAEGAVLLKNKHNALPVARGSRVSLFGRNSTDWVYGTSEGAAMINTRFCESLKTVMEKKEFGLVVNPVLNDMYSSAPRNTRRNADYVYRVGEIGSSYYTQAVRDSYSQYSDVAFMTISRANGEGSDFSVNPSDVKDGDGTHRTLQLQDNERFSLSEAKRCSDTVIVLLNTDYPMEIGELVKDDDVDAILWVGSTGMFGLDGTMRVIVGDVAPSGHLTDTWATSSISSPAMENFGDFTFANASAINATTADHYVIYQEGIYIGYKYYETRYEDLVLGTGKANSKKGATQGAAWDYKDEVLYSFGYGLSYTTFTETVTDFNLSLADKTATMKVRVENTGSVPGKHVVQVYAQSPYTEYDKLNKVEKSAVQLLDFEKTDIIEPGAANAVTVTLKMDLNLLASYDYTKAKTFIFDAGTYYFALGNGAHDALNNILAAKGKTATDNGMDYDGDAKLVKSYFQPQLDVRTFATAKTGATITNHLDNIDINYYDFDLKYLSRKDWDDTYPTRNENITATPKMIAALKDGAAYTPDAAAKDFSHVVNGVDYNSKATTYQLIALKGLDFDNPLWDDLLSQLTIEELSGTVAQARNGGFACSSVSFAGAVQADGPAGIRNSYITEEDGLSRSGTMFQSECVLASTFSKELAREQGEMFGEDGLWMDTSSAWAPGSNTHRTPYNGRNTEYLSEDGVLAGIIGREECIGGMKYGVAMAPKHFAFNDQETHRGGLATFANEQAGREIILRAFELPFASGVNVGSMLSTNRIGCYYSGAHYDLLQKIVREEWGMHGGFVTDMIGSSNGGDFCDAYSSVIAGTTMFNCNATTVYAGPTGRLNEQRVLADANVFAAVKERAHNNLYMWVNSNAMNGVASNSRVIYVRPWWQTLLIAMISVFAVITAAGVAGLVLTSIKEIKDEKEAN